jgi:excisionase family DNA binding protein
VGVEEDTTMRDRLQLQSKLTPNLVPRYLLDGNASSLILNRPARMTVDEIARRLDIGRVGVYAMLEQGIIPAVRLGRRWIVTRRAFETWERTCGMPTGLQPKTEHKVT